MHTYWQFSGESVIDEALDAIFDSCQATIKHGDSFDSVLVKLLGAVPESVEEIGCVQPVNSAEEERARSYLHCTLYNRDVVLPPLDNILTLRRKYIGEEQHKIVLQQQHKLFT